jgi:lysozyme family protein
LCVVAGSADIPRAPEIAACPEEIDWVWWKGELVQLTKEMRDDYEQKFASCLVNGGRNKDVEPIITRILKNRDRYERVAARTGVPFYVIGVIHNMECGGRFDCHLHNGDPLTAKTRNVPADRPPFPLPKSGAYDWEESAVDALSIDGFTAWRDWTIAGTLFKIEAFNGYGYRKHGVPSAYLWAASQFDINHNGLIEDFEAKVSYHGGKYVADGKWDAKAMSTQIGAAVVLRRMVDQHLVEVPPAEPH